MPKTKAHLIAAIRTRIDNAFETGDEGELLMTCPFDQETSYDLYQRDHNAKWDLAIDDILDPACLPSENRNLPSLEDAKTRVATLIAEKLLAAKSMLDNAQSQGIEIE